MGREKVYLVPSRSVVTFVEVGHKLKVGIVERVMFMRRELRRVSVTVKRACCDKTSFCTRELLL